MYFETRNAISTNEILSILLFFIKVWVIIKEAPSVIWVNYSIIFPSLNGSLISAKRPVYVLPLIGLSRFLVIECPCHFANLIMPYMSCKGSSVWPSWGNVWWFTRSFVDLENGAVSALSSLQPCIYYSHGTCNCYCMSLLTFLLLCLG